MRRTIFLILTLTTIWYSVPAQINGPMVGHSDHLEATVWMQCHHPCRAGLAVWPADAPDSLWHLPMQRSDARQGHAMKFNVDGLVPGRSYHYQVSVDGVTVPFDEQPTIQTPVLWRHRTDAPDLTVVMGSCAYINEPAYDRPGKPYGGDYQIFDAMADEAPDVVLWLGDNVYLREPDWGSRSGYLHRYTHARSTPEMQRLLRTGAHYAIWDDHDFGPNDPDGSWPHAPTAREMFELFWANPTFGVPGAETTVATAFNRSDIDFFLLDNRTHRVHADMRTVEPAMLGEGQMDWLMRMLKYSRAPFKLVAVGSQVLNSAAVFENYATISAERAELLRRIQEEDIRGVVFVTGDRHFTELSELTLPNDRKVCDLTVSPLTSGFYQPKEENKHRVAGTLVEQRNFATLRFTGPRGERRMTITIQDSDGQVLWEREIEQDKRR